MNRIMFNTRYGLHDAVEKGLKTRTLREGMIVNADLKSELSEDGHLKVYSTSPDCNFTHESKFRVGEMLSVLESYSTMYEDMKGKGVLHGYTQEKLDAFYERYHDTKGWNNKMFVSADVMFKRIEITDVFLERLQDISEENALLEGVRVAKEPTKVDIFRQGLGTVPYLYYIPDFTSDIKMYFRTPIDAFACLMDKLNGKGYWDANPYHIGYKFHYIDTRLDYRAK